ncbi:post-transcriptional regulator [Oceanobacillus sp. CAU 1775]
MDAIKNASQWKEFVVPFLISKVEELHIMGYSQATNDDVWKCLIAKVWKGDPEKKLHQVANDIMHLQSSTYLSYLTVESFKNDDLMASIAAIMKTE